MKKEREKERDSSNGESKASGNMIPEGYYPGKVVPVRVDDEDVWAQFGKTGTGSLQVVLHFEIISGDYKGRRLPWFGYFTDDSWERTMDALKIAGFEGDDIEEYPSQEVDAECSVTVEHNTYEGKMRARVAWVNKPGGGVVKVADPLDKKALSGLASKLKTKLAKRAERPDDDIPF